MTDIGVGPRGAIEHNLPASELDAGKRSWIGLTIYNYVSDAVYCNFDASGYRLPTEGEWEYFARAGTSTPFWVEEANFDANMCEAATSCAADALPGLEAVAWFCANRYDTAGYEDTKPVALKPANPWGLCDVHGNVWEWCWDWNGPYPTGIVTDYTGAESGTGRTIRGGAYLNQASALGSAHRRGTLTSQRNYAFGFCLVRTAR
jgi:formylglycine-generating enzyme required for sulfatase activity